MPDNEIAHYFFGELEKINSSRIYPPTESHLKQYLDSWLPRLIQRAEEAVLDRKECERLCDQFEVRADPDLLGLISLPLPPNPSHDGGYCHLVCRVWFSWASAGRVSSTGHAMVLTEAAWRKLEYNPFRLAPLVQGSSAFMKDMTAVASKLFTAIDSLEVALPPKADLPEEIGLIDTSPLTLGGILTQQQLETLLMGLSEATRQKFHCWTGSIGISRPFRSAFHLGVDRQGSAARFIKTAEIKSELEKASPTPLADLLGPHSWERPTPDREAPRASPAARRAFSRNFPIFAALIVLVVVLGMVFSRGSNDSAESNLKDWEQALRNRSRSSEVLLKDAANLLEADPTNARVRAGVERLGETLRSEIAVIVSKPDDKTLANSVRQLAYLDQLASKRSIHLGWQPRELLKKVQVAEEQMVAAHDRPDLAAKRRQAYDRLAGHYRDIPQEYVNPKLHALRESTEELEAHYDYQKLETRWKPQLAEDKDIAASEFMEEFRKFTSQHGPRFTNQAESLRNSIARAHESAWRKDVERAYEALKRSVKESTKKVEDSQQELKTVARNYREALAHWPKGSASLLDAEAFAEDIDEYEIFKFRCLGVGVQCGCDGDENFRLKDLVRDRAEICVKWEVWTGEGKERRSETRESPKRYKLTELVRASRTKTDRFEILTQVEWPELNLSIRQ